jgi:hypothetical protein
MVITMTPELRDILREALLGNNGEQHAELAERIVMEHSALVTDWMLTNAAQVITNELRMMNLQIRATYNYVRRITTGDGERVEVENPATFWESLHTAADGTKKPYYRLTKEDLMFVAGNHADSERWHGLRKEWYRARARKLRKGEVIEDRFTKEQELKAVAARFGATDDEEVT